MKELNDSRCLHGVKDGVKLLARVGNALLSNTLRLRLSAYTSIGLRSTPYTDQHHRLASLRDSNRRRRGRRWQDHNTLLHASGH